MIRKAALLIAASISILVTACQGPPRPSSVSDGAAAYNVVPVVAVQVNPGAINPGDHLTIKVLGEEELSGDYVVDDQGDFQLPLLGNLHVAGITTQQLREVITRQLGSRYIRNPAVAVEISARPRALFTVEGQVVLPGQYEVTPTMSLIGAMALAHSPTQTAKLGDVVIFRDIKGQRFGARFNLKDIRKGFSDDPQVLAGDTVVVGNSAIKSLWRDFLQAAPAIGVFASVARY